jgi:hypothetical protein
MLGIYHGATIENPAKLDFSGFFLPDSNYFKSNELITSYGSSNLTFMDVYLVNAMNDIVDIMWPLTPIHADSTSVSAAKSSSINASIIQGSRSNFWRNTNPLKCSAFVKRTNGEVILAHSTWGFYTTAQTMAITINVNGDMMSVNAWTPGQIGSATDFGFNNKGIMFNETTNRYNTNKTRTDGIFIFWRAALAEELSASLDDFFYYISLDNTGTYNSAYLLANANTGEIGLVDMSYKSFVFLKSNGSKYKITTLPKGQNSDYDTRFVKPNYILGLNYPPTLLVKADYDENENGIVWKDRMDELTQLIPGVHDVRTAKALLTYVNPEVRDNVMARFDLNIEPLKYGTAPFGGIDAKVVTSSMVRDFERLSGDIDLCSSARGFWMRYGTAYYQSKPFIWSQSEFSSWPHPDIPDALSGVYTYLKLNLR